MPTLQTLSERHSFRRLLDGDEWMLAEEIPDLDFFFSQVFLYSFGNDLSKACGEDYSKILCVLRGKDLKFYFGTRDCKRFCDHVLAKILAEPEFGEWVHEEIISRSDALEEQAKQAVEKNLEKLSNEELWKIYGEHVRLHRHLYEVGWLPNSIDMFYPEFTNYLKNYLRELLAKRGEEASEEKINSLLVPLTAPSQETIAQREQKSLLSIAIKIFNDAFHKTLFSGGLPPSEVRHYVSPAFRKLFEEHCESYRHLIYLYHGLPAGVFYYYGQAQELLASGKNLSEELQRINLQAGVAAETKKKLFEELEVDAKHQKLFELFGKFMASKWHRRNAQILALSRMENLLKEIGDRFGLSLWSVRVCAWREVEEMLLEGKGVSEQEMRQRAQHFVFYVEKNNSLVFTGEEALLFDELVGPKLPQGEVRELKGQAGCLGKATGRVRILKRAEDVHKFQQGEVLVAIATDPDIVPAMKRAAAIVTEQGGVTSHAAIVSREFNIPCVIGAKIATKVFRDGDLVEVDANKGVVRKL